MRKHRKEPKRTEFFCFWFHETNRNTTETDLVSVCFGSNQFLFCFENTLVLMFRKTCSSEFHGSYSLLQAQGERANGEFFITFYTRIKEKGRGVADR